MVFHRWRVLAHCLHACSPPQLEGGSESEGELGGDEKERARLVEETLCEYRVRLLTGEWAALKRLSVQKTETPDSKGALCVPQALAQVGLMSTSSLWDLGVG